MNFKSLSLIYRPYQCHLCERGFFRKYQLTMHLENHEPATVKRLSNYEFYSKIFSLNNDIHVDCHLSVEPTLANQESKIMEDSDSSSSTVSYYSSEQPSNESSIQLNPKENNHFKVEDFLKQPSFENNESVE